jgi:hypothetical protein
MLAALAGAVAVAVGCGDDNPDAGEVLDQTFTANAGVKSGTLVVNLEAIPKGGQVVPGQPNPELRFQLRGPFQVTGAGKLPTFNLSATLPAMPGVSQGGGTLAVANDGERMFLTMAGTTYELPPSVSEAANTAAQQFAASKGKPQVLEWLTDPKVEGETDVDGAATTHVSAGVDVPKMLEDVGGGPDPLTEEQRATVEKAVSNVRVDVYSANDNHALRRLRLAFDLAPPAAQSAPVPSGHVVIDVTVTDPNGGQQVKTPNEGRPFAELVDRLKPVAAAADQVPQGDDTLITPGQPAPNREDVPGPSLPPTVDPEKQRRWIECLGKKGTDVQALQECSKELE